MESNLWITGGNMMIKGASQDTSRYIVASNHCRVEEDDGRIEEEIP
jgi:hypothetical protein